MIISSSQAVPNKDAAFIRQKFGSFEAVLVETYRKAYEEFINTNEDSKLAIRKLFEDGRRVLLNILRQGKVTAIFHREHGSSNVNIIPRDEIRFQQNAHGYISKEAKSWETLN